MVVQLHYTIKTTFYIVGITLITLAIISMNAASYIPNSTRNKNLIGTNRNVYQELSHRDQGWQRKNKILSQTGHFMLIVEEMFSSTHPSGLIQDIYLVAYSRFRVFLLPFQIVGSNNCGWQKGNRLRIAIHMVTVVGTIAV